MFLVMVLNYVDLAAKEKVYQKLAISPKDGARLGPAPPALAALGGDTLPLD